MSLPPPSRLGRYRILSPRCGLRVSPLQLGTMSIGSGWPQLGAISKDDAFKLMDAAFDDGMNYFDSANVYQKEESEIWIGEWMKKRGESSQDSWTRHEERLTTCVGNRDDLVIATKYTANVKDQQSDKYPLQVNRSGNSLKSMIVSLEDSLKKLGTTYIDVFCESAATSSLNTRRCLVSVPFVSLTQQTSTGGTTQLRSRRSCKVSTTSSRPAKVGRELPGSILCFVETC